MVSGKGNSVQVFNLLRRSISQGIGPGRHADARELDGSTDGRALGAEVGAGGTGS